VVPARKADNLGDPHEAGEAIGGRCRGGPLHSPRPACGACQSRRPPALPLALARRLAPLTRLQRRKRVGGSRVALRTIFVIDLWGGSRGWRGRSSAATPPFPVVHVELFWIPPTGGTPNALQICPRRGRIDPRPFARLLRCPTPRVASPPVSFPGGGARGQGNRAGGSPARHYGGKCQIFGLK
jgi:hypothetical protein